MTPQAFDPLSVVAGVYMDRSIVDFQRACCVHILEEQRKASPDTALIALLCDAVRCSRELSKATAREQALQAEVARLTELCAAYHARTLKAEADVYAVRAEGKAEGLREGLEVLRKLRNECAGIESMAYDEIKQAAGYTNLSVWKLRIDEATAFLASRATHEQEEP